MQCANCTLHFYIILSHSPNPAQVEQREGEVSLIIAIEVVHDSLPFVLLSVCGGVGGWVGGQGTKEKKRRRKNDTMQKTSTETRVFE